MVVIAYKFICCSNNNSVERDYNEQARPHRAGIMRNIINFVRLNFTILIEDQCQINLELFLYKLSCRAHVPIPFSSHCDSSSHLAIIHLFDTTESSTIWLIYVPWIYSFCAPNRCLWLKMLLRLAWNTLSKNWYFIIFHGSISHNIATTIYCVASINWFTFVLADVFSFIVDFVILYGKWIWIIEIIIIALRALKMRICWGGQATHSLLLLHTQTRARARERKQTRTHTCMHAII